VALLIVDEGGIKDGVGAVTLAVTFAVGDCGESGRLSSTAIRSTLDRRRVAIIGEGEPCSWDEGEDSRIGGGFSHRASTRWQDVSTSRDSWSACNRRDWVCVVLEAKFDSELQAVEVNDVCMLPGSFGYV
jgi:hypothetical protein